jgi:Fe-S-cluster containining protein
MSVLITSAEAARLAAHLRSRGDFSAIRKAISGKAGELRRALPAPPAQAVNALLELGPCVFLDKGKCGVYEARPDGCRAAHVWHESWYCGRAEYDQCVPAELNEARVAEAFRLTLAEMDAGRKPYWGQILPAVWLMLERGEAYLAGEDLAPGLDPAWTSCELIEFPSREQALREQAEHAAMFRDEPYPLGSPRASECRSREDLRVFRVD